MAPNTADNRDTEPRPRFGFVRRVISFFVVAFLIGWTLHQLSAARHDEKAPAGFGRGMIDGALMPMALPNLAVGSDLTIYAANNTGRTYKLGYTVGVNVCGAIFFGFFFWRANRWRRNLAAGLKNRQSG